MADFLHVAKKESDRNQILRSIPNFENLAHDLFINTKLCMDDVETVIYEPEDFSTPREYTRKEFGRTASFSSIAVPIKRSKTMSVTDMIDTPGREMYISRLYKDFDILDLIGMGSFGSVYRTKSKIDNATYAVKESRHVSTCGDQSSMSNEAKILGKLTSSEESYHMRNIIRYITSWIENDHFYLQMELCDSNVELYYQRSHHTFTLDKGMAMLRDILTALDVVHRNGCAHLDIKPANILIKNDTFKLGDFGLAVELSSSVDVEEGDCRYMARELLDWGGVDDLTKCDIFSLGITVYELLTGDLLPYNGPVWQDLRQSKFTLPSSFASLAPLLYQLMASIPSHRPTASQCLQHSVFVFETKQNLRCNLLPSIHTSKHATLASLTPNREKRVNTI